MLRSVEKTGKSVDAAVFSALEELGATIDEVIVEVIDEGDPGILGIGRKPARVLVSLDRIGDDENFNNYEDGDEQYDYNNEKRNSKPYKNSELYSNADMASAENFKEGKKGDESPDNDESDLTPASEAVSAYLYNVLEALDIDAEISCETHGDSINIDIEGDDVGALIGRRGTTLSALQYLGSVVVGRSSGRRIRFNLDISGYKRKRNEELEALAIRTADKVIEVGKEYVMEAMPARDRRIIHATLQNYEGITTKSEGREPHRSVVIVPLNKSDRSL